MTRRSVPDTFEPVLAGGPMPVLVEFRDRLTGAAAAQVIDAKSVKGIRADPHIGPRGGWLYVVTVSDWADRPVLMTGPMPEDDAMAMVRKLHLAVAVAARG